MRPTLYPPLAPEAPSPRNISPPRSEEKCFSPLFLCLPRSYKPLPFLFLPRSFELRWKPLFSPGEVPHQNFFFLKLWSIWFFFPVFPSLRAPAFLPNFIFLFFLDRRGFFFSPCPRTPLFPPNAKRPFSIPLPRATSPFLSSLPRPPPQARGFFCRRSLWVAYLHSLT